MIADCKLLKELLTTEFKYENLYRTAIRINYLIHEFQESKISKNDFLELSEQYLNENDIDQTESQKDKKHICDKINELRLLIKTISEIF